MTLNNIIQRLEALASGHLQLNSFYYGDVVNFLSREDISYPACFADMNTASISKAGKQTTFQFRIWLCDLVNVSENSKDNELDVQSDLMSIAEDLIAMMRYSGWDDTWAIGENSSVQYYTEKFEDLVGALSFNIDISIRYDSNRCQVPTTLVQEPDLNPLAPYGYFPAFSISSVNMQTGGLIYNNILLANKTGYQVWYDQGSAYLTAGEHFNYTATGIILLAAFGQLTADQTLRFIS